MSGAMSEIFTEAEIQSPVKARREEQGSNPFVWKRILGKIER